MGVANSNTLTDVKQTTSTCFIEIACEESYKLQVTSMNFPLALALCPAFKVNSKTEFNIAPWVMFKYKQTLLRQDSCLQFSSTASAVTAKEDLLS